MDWLAAGLGLVGALIISKDVRIALVIWLISNILYIYFGWESGIYSNILRDGGYLLINSFTLYMRWRKP